MKSLAILIYCLLIAWIIIFNIKEHEAYDKGVHDGVMQTEAVIMRSFYDKKKFIFTDGRVGIVERVKSKNNNYYQTTYMPRPKKCVNIGD